MRPVLSFFPAANDHPAFARQSIVVYLEHLVGFQPGWLPETPMTSRRNQPRRFSYLRAVLFAVMLLLPGAVVAQSQPRPGSTPTPPPEPPSSNPTKQDSSTDFGSPENEMRARQMLKAEKKQYDENLARAREVAEIATHLVETYKAKKIFTSDESKKLERLERLTKRIRSEAGGSETDPDVKDMPDAMEAVVKRVAELADGLRKLVEDTPRHVISASVIDQTNKILGLIQHVRDTAASKR